MGWEIRIGPVLKSHLREFLSVEAPGLFDAQMAGSGVKGAALENMRTQFLLAERMAALVADHLKGPKVQGVIKGHSSGRPDEGMPPGTESDRIAIDIYEVRFVGDQS